MKNFIKNSYLRTARTYLTIYEKITDWAYKPFIVMRVRA